MRNTAISFVWPFCENIGLLKSLVWCLILGTYSINKLHPTFTPFYSYVFQQFASFPTQFSSVQSLSPLRPSQPHGLQHARSSCQSPTPRVYSNSCPLSRWCHPTISSSVITFSSHLQSFPASGTFQMSQSFGSGGQSIGVSASASVLPMNIQDWFPLGWTHWISLLSKQFSSLLQHHSSKASFLQHSTFFSPTLTSIHDYWKNWIALTRWTLFGKVMSLLFNMLSRLS